MWLMRYRRNRTSIEFNQNLIISFAHLLKFKFYNWKSSLLVLWHNLQAPGELWRTTYILSINNSYFSCFLPCFLPGGTFLSTHLTARPDGRHWQVAGRGGRDDRVKSHWGEEASVWAQWADIKVRRERREPWGSCIVSLLCISSRGL